jgi:dipeptidyl aminopeptidase/acylaminoacyl peptidase
MLYELLTGQRPFRGDEAETQSSGRSTSERIIYAHLNLPAPDPRRLNPSIPASLAQATLQALEKDPVKRFGSVREFYTSVAGALSLNPAAVPDRIGLAAPDQPAAEQTLAAIHPLLPETQDQPPKSPTTQAKPRPGRPAWLIPAIGAGVFILALCLIAGFGYLLSKGLAPNPTPGAPAALPVTGTMQITEPSPQPTIELTHTPEAITIDSPAPHASPTINADWHQGKLVFPRDQDNGRALFLLDLSLGPDAVLLAAPPRGQRFMGPAWSPDSERIAFYNQTTKDILLIDAFPGAEPDVFTPGSQPTWSPDGNNILYRTGDGFFTIRDVATNEEVRRVDVAPGANLPDWSPQGDTIAYSILAGNGATSIWKQAISGGEAILLNDRSFQNYAPRWSHDGQLIAYQSDKRSGVSEIWVMDRNGDNARRITDTPNDAWSRAPTWSPDDQWIAFVSSQAGSIGSDYGEIFIIPAAGGDPIQITFTGGSIYDWRIDWGK